MNDSPNVQGTPFGDATDEALTALMDGELAAFAVEHGTTEDAARARLEAWPETEVRLAELDRIRAAVQAPVAPLDDVIRHRLLRGATDVGGASPPAAARSRRWVAITAVAASGLLVIAGIGAALSSTGGSDGTKSSQSAASGGIGAPALQGNVGNLGDVTSAPALRALLDRRQASLRAGEKAVASAAPSTGSALQPGAPHDTGTANVPAVDPQTCAHQLAGSRPVTFSGTGTYRGAAVTIVGIGKGGRSIVFVVSSTDCMKVLASISR